MIEIDRNRNWVFIMEGLLRGYQYEMEISWKVVELWNLCNMLNQGWKDLCKVGLGASSFCGVWCFTLWWIGGWGWRIEDKIWGIAGREGCGFSSREVRRGGLIARVRDWRGGDVGSRVLRGGGWLAKILGYFVNFIDW